MSQTQNDSTQKVWMWAVKYGKDKVWEHTTKPEIISIKSSILEQTKFYDAPMIELSLIQLRTIMFLFHTKESAEIYAKGYLFGRDIEKSGDDVWQDRLDKYIDHSLNSSPITDEDGMLGYKY